LQGPAVVLIGAIRPIDTGKARSTSSAAMSTDSAPAATQIKRDSSAPSAQKLK
jgi:hypothetical protein